MISSSDFRKIKAIILDVDGTLTDGRYSFDADGNVIKFFNMQDTHWIRMALREGLKIGLLSGSTDEINLKFAKSLDLSFAVNGSFRKAEGFEQILSEQQLAADECLYAGDDVTDIPVLKRAGIAAVPANALPELDEVSPWRTRAAGGAGAVVEIIRRVLAEKGLLDKAMERYRQ